MAISALAVVVADAAGAERLVALMGTIGMHCGALMSTGTSGIGRLLMDAKVEAGNVV
jgi:hypothetical protein